MLFTELLISRLRNAGIPAFPAYARKCREIPAEARFVTVAKNKTDYYPPIAMQKQFAVPFSCQFRICMYASPEQDIDAFSEQVQDILLNILISKNCNVRSVQHIGQRYDAQTDRMTEECILCLSGMLYCTPEEEANANTPGSNTAAAADSA
ncbi:MAG: hypothetical protein MJ071_05080 [Oscillospiraceae bacterium]|nr:hypothetical protein [Oscillospiraceae bacterium]